MGFPCLHISPSSHFPLDISDILGFFSEEVFGRGDVGGSSYSFPHLSSKHRREQLWSSHTSVYMTPPCAFYSMVQLPTAAGRRDQCQPHPTGDAGTSSGVGAGVLLVFPMPSAKAADPETPRVDWASVWERSR